MTNLDSCIKEIENLSQESHAILKGREALRIAREFDFRPKLKALGTYKKNSDVPVEIYEGSTERTRGLSSLGLATQICERLGLDSETGYIGRGFQLRAMCETIRKHLESLRGNPAEGQS